MICGTWSGRMPDSGIRCMRRIVATCCAGVWSRSRLSTASVSSTAHPSEQDGPAVSQHRQRGLDHLELRGRDVRPRVGGHAGDHVEDRLSLPSKDGGEAAVGVAPDTARVENLLDPQGPERRDVVLGHQSVREGAHLVAHDQQLADQHHGQDEVEREREGQEESQPAPRSGRGAHGVTRTTAEGAAGSGGRGGSVWIGSQRTSQAYASTMAASAPAEISTSVLAGRYVSQL